MMVFRTIKAAYVALLDDQSLGRFRVLGYDSQSKHSEAIKGSKQLVEVIYNQGQFPKASSNMYGPVSHDISYDIVLSTSANAKGDLTVLDNTGATPEQKTAALASIKNAAQEADDKIDEFIEIIYQILMDARNEYAGLTDEIISNRWVDSIQKFDALEHGNLVVKTAVIKFSCRVSEDILGETGNSPDEVVVSTDFSEGTGIDVNNDNT